MRLLIGLLGLTVWGGVSGCSSIYHETRQELPPDPVAECRERLEEAQQAGAVVHAAGVRLEQRLNRADPDDVVSVAFDRLDAALFDLERRVLAVNDAVARCGNPVALVEELEQLRRTAGTWRDYVDSHRKAERADQLRYLEPLVRRGGGP